jgi:hypothetical protein
MDIVQLSSWFRQRDFYCARERRKETQGILNSLVPINISWLRLKCVSGVGANWFGESACVRRLSVGYENMNLGGKDQHAKSAIVVCSVCKWGIIRQGIHVASQICGEPSTLMTGPLAHIHVYQAYQCPDDSDPHLSPDLIDGSDESERRIMCNERLMNASSAQHHCRQYSRCFCIVRSLPVHGQLITQNIILFTSVSLYKHPKLEIQNSTSYESLSFKLGTYQANVNRTLCCSASASMLSWSLQMLNLAPRDPHVVTVGPCTR